MPDRVTMFSAGPAVHPNSAENALERTEISWMAPTGTVAIMVWRPHPSSLLAPSSMKVVVRRLPPPVTPPTPTPTASPAGTTPAHTPASETAPSASPTGLSPSASASATPSAGNVRAYTLAGGHVTLDMTNGAVQLVTAVPDAGYSVQTWSGTGWLRVDFSSGPQVSSLIASWYQHAPTITVTN